MFRGFLLSFLLVGLGTAQAERVPVPKSAVPETKKKPEWLVIFADISDDNQPPVEKIKAGIIAINGGLDSNKTGPKPAPLAFPVMEWLILYEEDYEKKPSGDGRADLDYKKRDYEFGKTEAGHKKKISEDGKAEVDEKKSSKEAKPKTYDYKKLALACAEAYLKKKNIEVTDYVGITIIHDLFNGDTPVDFANERIVLANKEPIPVYFVNYRSFIKD
jgi:hypothetical protein